MEDKLPCFTQLFFRLQPPLTPHAVLTIQKSINACALTIPYGSIHLTIAGIFDCFLTQGCHTNAEYEDTYYILYMMARHARKELMTEVSSKYAP